MDNYEVDSVYRFITKTLHVDIPLYYNNPGKSIRFDFEDVDTEQTENIIKAVVYLLFGCHPFWICEYGSVTGKAILERGLLAVAPKISVIPYISSVDKDYFEYEHDAIACAHTNIQAFSVCKYISYVLEKDFISNSIFLIDEVHEVALYVYDRRGMDVASTDNDVLKRLLEKFSSYTLRAV